MLIDLPKQTAHFCLTGSEVYCYCTALLGTKMCLQRKITFFFLKITHLNQRQYGDVAYRICLVEKILDILYPKQIIQYYTVHRVQSNIPETHL